MGEIVDDVEINVCFLLTRKSLLGGVDCAGLVQWFRPRVECSVLCGGVTAVTSPGTQTQLAEWQI